MTSAPVVVFGAAGHTGRFVVDELARRGRGVVLAGRDRAKLASLQARYPAAEVRAAEVSDAAALDRALAGCAAVIHCAGPFLDTAAPVIEAALRARIHYLDVCAEQATTRATFERFDRPAQEAGIAVVPSVAFYGGLADLLVTAALDVPDTTGAADIDDIAIAVALDSWHPTAGTRLTGERNTVRRVVISEHQLTPLADPSPRRSWTFPAPFGTQEVVAVPLSEIITISRHLRAREVHSFMNLAPLADLNNESTPAPVAADASGRSAQQFVMDVVVRRGASQRRVTARGRDIYAITAPLVVEATERLLAGPLARAGASSAGALFDARAFLAAISPDPLEVAYETLA